MKEAAHVREKRPTRTGARKIARVGFKIKRILGFTSAPVALNLAGYGNRGCFSDPPHPLPPDGEWAAGAGIDYRKGGGKRSASAG